MSKNFSKLEMFLTEQKLSIEENFRAAHAPSAWAICLINSISTAIEKSDFQSIEELSRKLFKVLPKQSGNKLLEIINDQSDEFILIAKEEYLELINKLSTLKQDVECANFLEK